jgi:hypothetical protein
MGIKFPFAHLRRIINKAVAPCLLPIQSSKSSLQTRNETLGGGSAFLVNGLLVTNHHVFMGYQSANRVGIRRDDMPPDLFRSFSPDDFAKRLLTGSNEQSYDYAVLNIQRSLQRTIINSPLNPPVPLELATLLLCLLFS